VKWLASDGDAKSGAERPGFFIGGFLTLARLLFARACASWRTCTGCSASAQLRSNKLKNARSLSIRYDKSMANDLGCTQRRLWM